MLETCPTLVLRPSRVIRELRPLKVFLIIAF